MKTTTSKKTPTSKAPKPAKMPVLRAVHPDWMLFHGYPPVTVTFTGEVARFLAKISSCSNAIEPGDIAESIILTQMGCCNDDVENLCGVVMDAQKLVWEREAANGKAVAA